MTIFDRKIHPKIIDIRLFEFSRAFSVLSARAVTSQTSLILIPIKKQATNMLDLFAFCPKKKA